MKGLKSIALGAMLTASVLLHGQTPVFNRLPLEQNEFAALPLGSVEPQGWLLDQMQRMCKGLSGHLDEIYPEVVGDDNAWLGGEGDTWERGPYWIDGLLPLAYIMKDEALIAKTLKWAEAIMRNAGQDGNIGNVTDRPFIQGLQRNKARDWWPRMVVAKILMQYYMATGDSRATDVLMNYFRYQAANLDKYPLGRWSFWGKWRSGDNLSVIYWLYNLTGEKFLLDLGETIHSQTVPFTKMFYDPMQLMPSTGIHCVNLGQGLKYPVVHWQYSHDAHEKDAPKKALETIRQTIGFPTGLWAGDELLQFGDPTRGSELCTAVEAMFSAEEMLTATGDPFWADYLERICFNALPTQVTDAFDAKQYFQQVNQIACTWEERPFSSDHDGTDTVFGTLNGYPCCLCNLHQGWPKFTANLWHATRDGGLAALVYAPCKVSTTLAGGIPVSITEETFYPFRETVCFTVSYTSKKKKQRAGCIFPLSFRVPQWCSEAGITLPDGQTLRPKAGQVVRVERLWKDGDRITLNLPMKIVTSEWFGWSTTVERGPLVYALKMNENWERRQFPAEMAPTYGSFYYEVTSDSPWNYGLSKKAMKRKDCFTFEELPTDGAYPWTLENAPVRILAKAWNIPEWAAFHGDTAPVGGFKNNRASSFQGEPQTIELIPYGCTTLRICEFPTRL
ncbi:MAG: glycoside hydrolase family 127 protein [Bacteroidales bacterium]|nr:glycoside hydrolase family 127 protein [Bacteroidales bacterium]